MRRPEAEMKGSGPSRPVFSFCRRLASSCSGFLVAWFPHLPGTRTLPKAIGMGLSLAALALGCAANRPSLPRHPGAPPALAAPAPRPTPHPGSNPVLRIGLRKASGGVAVTVVPSARAMLVDAATGHRLAVLPSGQPARLVLDVHAGQIQIERPGPVIAAPSVRIQVRGGRLAIPTTSGRYPSPLLVYPAAGGLQVVNEVRLETYLEGVLPGELPPSFAPEAQKALAVAARTYALRNLDKHTDAGYDLCDGPHCQVYLGHTTASPRGLRAVRATRGLCVWFRGQLACTFYSADCGGQTTFAREVPLPDMPAPPPSYLRPVRDAPRPAGPDYCRRSSHHWWSARVPVAELEARLNEDPGTAVGKLLSARFGDRDVTGRVQRVFLEGEVLAPTGATQRLTRMLSGWEFRRRVGPRQMRSTLAKIERVSPEEFRITGTGNGHGLGLCQIGADGMARPPYYANFRQILRHYYPGVQVGKEG
ncbi:MAG: SpoIID/LytB domain-containing protein [Armatimonadetes bacterium]|nr:SpoIID/LytB domain-containing protein [Armatimonadota bacterium]